MKQVIKTLLSKAPYIRNLTAQVQHLTEQVRRQGAFPAGHYYSPIPSAEDVLTYAQSEKLSPNELLGIDLNQERQLELLHDYIDFYQDVPFPEEQTPGYRYYYNNLWFGHSDAIFLYSYLRKYQPKRIIEVGSGFSSAVMLDTIEHFFAQRPEITFIEPDPERLMSLWRAGDSDQVRLIDSKVQDVPWPVFSTLESGDFLFIDSSHVVKCGSDLQWLMFEILPRLHPGVMVHFHDVFYPFDYPSEWLIEGRYWNENYFLRAFLSYNAEWSIQFFNTFVHFKFGDLMKAKMPLCTHNPGGSLYILREPKV